AFAVGDAVTLAGLIVNLEVVAPTGVAITVLAAIAWIRGTGGRPRPRAEPARSEPAAGDAERFPRSRLLESATLGLGGLVAAGVALPAIGAAVIPAFTRNKPRAIDLGPIGAFPEGEFVIATFLSDPRQARSRAGPRSSGTTASSGSRRASPSCSAAARTLAARRHFPSPVSRTRR